MISEATNCLILLARVHHSLHDRLEVLHALSSTEKLNSNARQLADNEITAIVAAAESWANANAIFPVAIDQALVDPTPKCCRVLVSILSKATSNVEDILHSIQAHANDVGDAGDAGSTCVGDKVSLSEAWRHLHGTVALLRLSAEACASAGITGITPSLIGVVQKAIDLCFEYKVAGMTPSKAFPKSLPCELERLLFVAVTCIHPTAISAGNLFFDVPADTSDTSSRSIIRTFALDRICSASAALEFLGGNGSHGRLACLIDSALETEGIVAVAARRVVALYQSAALAKASGDPGSPSWKRAKDYTAILMPAVVNKISAALKDVADVPSKAVPALSGLRSTVGTLLATWLSGTFAKGIAVESLAVELLPLLQQLTELTDTGSVSFASEDGLMPFDTFEFSGETYMNELSWVADLTRATLCHVQLGCRDLILSLNGVLSVGVKEDGDVSVSAVPETTTERAQISPAVTTSGEVPFRIRVSGAESSVSACNGVYVQSGVRNDRPCFDKEGEVAGGAMYFDATHWKICRDGSGMQETGWNYSQTGGTRVLVDAEEVHGPPLGLWDSTRNCSETSRDYTHFTLDRCDSNGNNVDQRTGSQMAAAVSEPVTPVAAPKPTDSAPGGMRLPKDADIFVQRGLLDPHTASPAGFALHSLCNDIAKCDGDGRDLLMLCGKSMLSNSAEANLARSVFAALIWHCARLGDCALDWKQARRISLRSASGPAFEWHAGPRPVVGRGIGGGGAEPPVGRSKSDLLPVLQPPSSPGFRRSLGSSFSDAIQSDDSENKAAAATELLESVYQAVLVRFSCSGPAMLRNVLAVVRTNTRQVLST